MSHSFNNNNLSLSQEYIIHFHIQLYNSRVQSASSSNNFTSHQESKYWSTVRTPEKCIEVQ